ncbi:MAG: HEAT repeat domain-containing protein [Phycisphaerae bacterium]|nr:HEAT repeat domain-containing protein [Phycisphaerae bacterium]
MDRIRCVVGVAAIVALFGLLGLSPAAERKYAPDRVVDIGHVMIDVTPDFKNRTISGKTTVRFVPIAEPARELKLDAQELTVTAVESSVKIAGHETTDEHVIITFAEPIAAGKEATVTISHKAEPRNGLFFRTPEMGYPAEDIQVWTQGEPHRAPYWYPSFDYPNERFTSEVICHVPRDMIVLSNGRQVSETPEAGTGFKAVRWVQDKPHVNYLIALVAGRFKGLHEKYRDVPLGFHTPPTQFEQARNSFRDTADMMGFLERELEVPYPWYQYNQVVVEDFVVGGMENTTLTVLTDRTLFTEASETIRSSQNLVVHEMTHQWFGDYVTCKDWSHIWLNEGFATYYAHLYDGYKNGRDSMLYGLYQDAQRILGAGEGPRPIVCRAYGDAHEMFDYRSYKKGSWVLHMLRTGLGKDLYRRCITEYVKRYALQSVVTEDLSAVFEETTGRSFDRFFDQWIYHARHPELTVSTSWSETEKLAKVSVRQTQAVNDKVLLFEFETKVRFGTGSGAVERDIKVDEKEQDFFFGLPEAPKVVRFDPEYGLLAKVSFDKPTAMLHAQLADRDDVVGRLLAVEALKSKKDKETVAKLKEALGSDGFYGVRVEAAKALRALHTPEAFEALVGSRDQPDARARLQVVQEIGGFYSAEARGALEKVLKVEKNPEIVAAAITGLGKYHEAGIREILVGYLKSSSYQNRIAEGAIRAIRVQDDPAYVVPLMEVLRQREKDFTSRGFGEGLKALGYIARDGEDRDKVREFLVGYVNHKKQQVQIDSINALGELRDPKAIGVVETFAGHRGDDPVQYTAREALKKLREAKKVPVELGDLRTELLDLKKAQEELRKDLDEMEGRLKASEKAKGKPPVTTSKPAHGTTAPRATAPACRQP